MKLIKKALLLTGIISAMIDVAYAQKPAEPSSDYALKQVVVLTRHGLRAPLVAGAQQLIDATPYQWQAWDTDGGILTTKGGALEVFMGGYFNQWVVQNNLLPKNTCPTEADYHVYTNVILRTIATAQFFTAGAFPGCDNIKINHFSDLASRDPIFYPAVKENSPAFQAKVTKEIHDYIAKQDLGASYAKLEQIIDYKNSVACKVQKQCDLSQVPNVPDLTPDQEPLVNGGIRIGFLIVDAFMLQDYEGFPSHQVAWGNIKSAADWQSIAKIRNAYIDATFLQPAIVKNIIQPMLKRLDTLMPAKMTQAQPKVTLLSGHDTTVGPVITALGVNEYQLPGQYEKTPIGGEVVFQRWYDKKHDRDLLKVEYVYQSTEQLRNLSPLSLKTPPQRVTLSFKGCDIDTNGFCPWQDFRKVIYNALH
ncbi:bifunctional glucose-1-phosphatase/inositol phosphatase [Utexia brackfieldae]|uniref:bifunctional glucose-1-phosphatase/inositol phosphatase n=1 Tax=Utexia brackfieldae TaxID=3074108 RepID=UPI00370D7F21